MAFHRWGPSSARKFLVHQKDRIRSNGCNLSRGQELAQPQCRCRDIRALASHQFGADVKLARRGMELPGREAARKPYYLTKTKQLPVDKEGRRDHWFHRHSSSIE